MPEKKTQSEQNESEHIDQSINVSGKSGPIYQIGKIIVNAGNSINDQIFTRLGIETRLGFVLTAVLIIVVVAVSSTIVILTLQPKPPGRMTGDFRIAIAAFDVQSNNDENAETALQLAEGVMLRLDENITELDLNFTTQVWGPELVGEVKGETPEARATAAETLAQEIEADIVVYGLVDDTVEPWKITPEFYVSVTNFYEAQEIVGDHRLGASFSIASYDNLASRLQVSDSLSSQVEILTRITVGLAYFAFHDYEKSLEHFEVASQVSAIETEGEKVIYLLMGNAAGRAEDIELAESYYLKSLNFDGEYARAYIGLGSVHYQKALANYIVSNNPEDIDVMELNKAIEQIQKAKSAKNQPILADIDAKVHFGLGQAYFIKVYSGEEKYFDQTMAEFNAVIDLYNDGENPRIQELAAESHGRLGLIYNFVGDNEQAIMHYRLAASLAGENPERKAIFENRANEIEKQIDEE